VVRSERIAEILRQRLAAGDYALRAFPAERDLACELGASYLTARKAVQQLIAEGLLRRAARGRAEPVTHDHRPIIAYLCPDWPSLWSLQLRQAIEAAAEAAGCAFITQHYLHWDDPCIGEVLRRAAGVLFVPLAEDAPQRVLASLAGGGARVLVSSSDLASHGLHTLDRLPASAVRVALDHLAARGHRRIWVFNVQPLDPTIRTRIDEARVWARRHPQSDVTVLGTAVASGVSTWQTALEQARVLLADPHPAPAVLGLTLPAAQGMVRAAADRGMLSALAIATIDGEDLAEHLVPAPMALR
jgi:DNA-binding LacI/PurR family transcriptional regulator